jgi:hypothetical protein
MEYSNGNSTVSIPITWWARVSYVIPLLLSLPLTGMLLGWDLRRFTISGYLQAIFSPVFPRNWYDPALIVAITLAVFGVAAFCWFHGLRALLKMYFKSLKGKDQSHR